MNVPGVNVLTLPDVTLANTVDVTVANTLGVNVVNGASSAVWTRSADAGQSVFQQTLDASFVSGETVKSATFYVPGGKRLIIENVSVRTGRVDYVELETLHAGGASATEHYLDLHEQPRQSVEDDPFWVANHDLRAYAVGTVNVRAIRSNTTGFTNFKATIVGTLVDLP